MGKRSVGREISKLSRKISTYLNIVLKKHDITSGTMGFLGELIFKDNICLEELSRLRDCDKGTTTRAVTLLEKKGFINKVPHPTHRKKRNVVVTEEGKKVQKAMLKDLGILTEILFKDVTTKEQNVFFETLEKLNKNIITEIKENL